MPSKEKTGGKVNYNVRYIQHEQKTPHKLNIDTLDYRQYKELYFKLKQEERETLNIDFGIHPDILKLNYLDVYKGVYAEWYTPTNSMRIQT